jgi:membrane protein implicated in regulation of membrane protease activity
VLGYVSASIFWRLSRSEVGVATTLGQLRGTEADVVLPIRVGGTGKIGLKVSGQYTELLARTNDATDLAMRERVLVVSVQDGVAVVTSVRARRS